MAEMINTKKEAREAYSKLMYEFDSEKMSSNTSFLKSSKKNVSFLGIKEE